MFSDVNNLLICHLVAIAAHPGCASFTDGIVAEIVFLLKSICTKGPAIFSHLIRQFVSCLAGRCCRGNSNVYMDAILDLKLTRAK